MKKFLTLAFVLLMYSLIVTAQPLTQWQTLQGGINSDYGYGFNIQQTSDEGYITAGYSSSSNSGTLIGITNNGGIDGWVRKLDANGNTQWQKLLGGSGDDEFWGIKQTADGGYIAEGYTNSSNSGTLTGITNNGGMDGWVVKLDGNGNTTWQKLFGGVNNDYLYGVTQAVDGSYLVAGQSESSNTGTLTGITNHGGPFDGWVIKLTSSGSTTWQKLLGGDNVDALRLCQQTIDGGYIITGYTNSTSNTGTLTGLTNHGAEDGWVIKLDASGNTVWQKLLGGDNTDYLNSIQQTADGGYIASLASRSSSNSGTLTGLTNNGGYDGWVIKLDGIGNTTWQKLLGGSNDDYFYSCLQTSDGGYILAGYSRSTNSGTLTGIINNGIFDGWLIKLNANGSTQWQQLLGGSDDDEFFTVNQSDDGGYIIGGFSQSSNSGTLTGVTSNGGYDSWVLKLEIPKITVTSYDTLASCSSKNSISFKVTNGISPYTVQLYRFGLPYGSVIVTDKSATFKNLPDGSYYATANSGGVIGTSKTVDMMPIPTNPSTTNIQSAKAKLNWTTVSCSDYYSVQYRVHGTTKWTKKKTTGNVGSYTLKNLTPSTTYDWEVAAIDSANGINATSPYTDSVVFTTSSSFAINQSRGANENVYAELQLITVPNPAANSFRIEFNPAAESNVTAVLYNVVGKMVWSSGEVDASLLNGKIISASSFGSGLYFLRIINNKSKIISQTKVIINK
ncbi:MAG: fibronectin type III domain-containing protein [Chitinophagales bacterium]|nr:fibronectin type III domain-containing protein [Chitinophagales bacterium]